MFTLLQESEVELALAGRALGEVLARPEFAAEREDGPGQRRAKEVLLNNLAADLGVTRTEALQVIADAGKLQDAQGNRLTVRSKKNVKPEPDLAYNARVGRTVQRVNIEVDSNPQTAVDHMKLLTKGDPQGRHVALVVDPVSGEPRHGLFWDPKVGQMRSLNPKEIKEWQSTGRPPQSLMPKPLAKQTNTAVPPRPPIKDATVDRTLAEGIKKINQTPHAKTAAAAAQAQAKQQAAQRQAQRTARAKARAYTRAHPPARVGRQKRQKEMELAAYELAAELGGGPERMDVDVPGIPGNNQFFASAGEARRAALRDAQRAGLGHRLAHDPRPARGQPHYHIVRPDGTRVSGHYFYGRRMPRRVLRGRPNREFEFAFAG